MATDRAQLARQELARRELARRGVSLEAKPVDSMQTMGAGGYAKAHPFKTAFQPLSKTITGQSTQERFIEPKAARMAIGGNPVGSYFTGLAGDIESMAEAPVSWAGGALAKPIGMAGKAIAGTKAGQTIGGALNTPIQQVPGKVGKAVSDIPKRILDYAGNKVSATRSGMKDYWKREVEAYGKTIESLGDNVNQVEATPLIENFTQKMVERKLYDPLSEKWVKPLNKVDTQLLKSYSSLAREWQNTGKLKVGNIVKEYQAIKNSAPVESSFGREARNLANEMIQSIKDQINIPIFKKANERYAHFRTNFDAIDGKIDVWGNALKTGRGERFLTSELLKTKESRTIANKITEVTGQKLKGARTLSAVKLFPGAKAIFR